MDKEKALSKRELFSQRMKGRYPDREFADDEELFGQINDDYESYDGQLKQYKEREKSISDLFASDPRSARFLMSWKDGEYPLTALIRQFGKDALQEMVENEDRLDEFAAANAEYLERVAEGKRLEEEYSRNIAASLSLVEKMQGEKGLSDERMDAALETLFSIVRDGIEGKFSQQSIELALKANGYDEAVADAAHEGEVRGRNARIDEKLRTARAGDGVASLAGKNTTGAQRKRTMNIFDYAEAAK